MSDEITVSAEEVEELAGKLDTLSDSLNENEQALLLAIFRIAGSAIAAKGDVEGFAFSSGTPSFALQRGGSLPSLSHGFQTAFVKGVGGGINPAADISVDGSVSVMGTMSASAFQF